MNDELFVQAYLSNGLNATRAYLAVHPKAKTKTAGSEGPRLLRRPDVCARLALLSSERVRRFEVASEDLLRHALAVALADARHLTGFSYFACRYCHGRDHKRQRTLAEFEVDKLRFETEERRREAACLMGGKDYEERYFDEEGGTGFNEWADPNPGCPNCHGRGIGRMEVADTRNLPPEAAILFAGVEETKDGLKVRMHDKMKALDMLFRHKGLFEADNAQQAEVVSSEMLAALDAAMERALTAARSRQLATFERRKSLGFIGN